MTPTARSSPLARRPRDEASSPLWGTRPCRVLNNGATILVVTVLASEHAVDVPASAHDGEGPIHLDGFVLELCAAGQRP
jgi:hypothetical protein